MASDKPVVHRTGAMKQQNKKHKTGRHRSKGSISQSTNGKISVKSLTKRNNKEEMNRKNRRNQAEQIRKNKRADILAKKRCLGSEDVPPFLVSIVPLNNYMDAYTALSQLCSCDDQAVITNSGTVTHINIPKFKQRFSFVIPDKDHDFAILDSLKIADTVMFLLSANPNLIDQEDLIDKWGQNVLSTTFAQGLPTPLVVLTDLEVIAPKKRHEHKMQVQKLVNKWLPDEKILVMDKDIDAVNVLRRIGSQKQRSVLYRDRRPHLYGEEVAFVPDAEGPSGTLRITGYLRGSVLSVNQLVHIPGLGDYQMSQIDAPYDPNKFKNAKNANKMDTEQFIRVLERCDPDKQESLQSENIPDPADNEQTWPTEEEIQAAEDELKANAESRKLKKVKRIPNGMSDYQAAWIPDEDYEDESDDSDDEEGGLMDGVSEENSENSDMEENEVAESEIAVDDDKYDKEMDVDAEKKEFEKIKDAKSHQEFPDEIDTPVDTLASVRFLKYRALESFRTSPWDKMENLPSDYARIFSYRNFNAIKKNILADEKNKEGVMEGLYITVHVKGISQLLWTNFEKTRAPVTLIGMFPLEHKMAVLNVELKGRPGYDQPIKSKERLVFQCGYRRFIVNPIFSSHTRGDKHKMERYFQPESVVVATFYAPIQLPPAPVLCYKEVNNKLVLVATGSLLSVRPDRLVIKRVALSGHPFKIHKNSAVVRFMFFNREDILFFKSAKIVTKMGRKGSIKEPLGTHGHMKCIFDGRLNQQDTIMLYLYKRVFPKWTYEDLVVTLDDDKMEC